MRTPLLAAILLSCSSEELTPRVSGVVAEVHLHQYDFGSHAAAGFIDTRVPYQDELDEVLVNFVIAPALVDGGWQLTIPSICTPACPGDTHYCSGSRCLPYQQLRFQNGGPVVVTGSSHVSPVTLAYNPKTRVYQSDQPFSTPVFRPGDRLTIESSGPWPFRAELVAPRVPTRSRRCCFPPRAPTASSGAFITCIAEDTGASTIPAAMMARVPPPPRFVQLDLERRARQKVVIRSGELAVVTLAATLVRDRND